MRRLRRKKVETSETFEHKREILRKNVQFAQSYLKKLRLPHAPHRVSQLPCYLLLGLPGVGKTSLMAASSQTFLHAEYLAQPIQADLAPTRHCNWWLSERGMVIDVPGHYLLAPQQAQALWKTFLAELAETPDGIVVQLSFERWLTVPPATAKKNLLALKEALQLLVKQFKKPFTVTFYINKLDLLMGFTDFFSDLGEEEKNRVLGIDLRNMGHLPHGEWVQDLHQSCHALLQRLYERLFWRLSQERNMLRRAALQNFLTQWALLKTSLFEWLDELTDILRYDTHVRLQGVYFGCARETGKSVDTLFPILSEYLEVAPDPFVGPQPPFDRHYFVRDFWPLLWQAAQKPEHERIKPTTPRTAAANAIIFRARHYICAALAFAVVVSAYSYRYVSTLNVIEKTQKQLFSAPQSNGDATDTSDLLSVLPLINSLEKISANLNSAHFPWILQQWSPALKQGDHVYANGLKKRFIPALMDQLGHDLMDTRLPAAERYRDLHLYYVLTENKEPLSKTYIHAALQENWSRIYADTPDVVPVLLHHLDEALGLSLAPTPSNPLVLARAKDLLFNLPPAVLLYSIMQDQALLDKPASDTRFALYEKIFGPEVKQYLPSFFYTRAFFETDYESTQENAKTILEAGNAFLGTPPRALSSRDLSENVRWLYWQDYAQRWRKFVEHLQLPQYKTSADQLNLLERLHDKKTGLMAILKNIASETTFAESSEAQANLRIFQPLQTLEKNHDAMNLVEVALRNLESEFEVTQRSDANALLFTRHYLNHTLPTDHPLMQLDEQSRTAPQPLQQWLTQIVQSTSKILVTQSLQYVDKRWQEEVFGYYQAHIAKRYPIVPLAQNEISAKDFTAFFGEDGILERFVSTYLTPLMDVRGSRWQWLQLNQTLLPLSPDVLIQLQRAHILRTMYFHDGTLGAGVTLALMNAAPTVDIVSISLNHDTFTDDTHRAQNHTLKWEVGEKPAQFSVALTDTQQKTTSLTLNGAWSFLRYLRDGHLRQLDDTRHFAFDVLLNGQQVTYTLTTPYLLNPFISNVVETFQLPSSLLQT